MTEKLLTIKEAREKFRSIIEIMRAGRGGATAANPSSVTTDITVGTDIKQEITTFLAWTDSHTHGATSRLGGPDGDEYWGYKTGSVFRIETWVVPVLIRVLDQIDPAEDINTTVSPRLAVIAMGAIDYDQ